MPSLGKRKSTQAALRQAVFRAVRLLESRLDNPPSAEEMAREAGISLFHFHRAFGAVIGESVSHHSTRLRIERAASLLKFSDWQVQEIGLVCGFATQSAFGRDFKKRYGMTPRQFREDEGVIPFLRGRMRTRGKAEAPCDGGTPQPTVRIESWPEQTAVCLRFYGPVDGIHVPWQELIRWAKVHVPQLGEARFLGLWFDDWKPGSDARESYRYECAIVPAAPIPDPPAPFFTRTISAGDVAIAQARGTAKALERAWRHFGHGWLPFSGYQPRDDFACDLYPAELLLGGRLRQAAAGLMGFSLGMCLPVQRGAMEV